MDRVLLHLIMTILKRLFEFILTPVGILLCCLPLSLAAQSNTPPSKPGAPDPKAEAIVTRAIEVLGGTAYLNIKTVVGRGFYTAFQDGMSQFPARFLDYLVYPDRERTEFTSNGIRVIQTNASGIGWVFDGATKTITD